MAQRDSELRQQVAKIDASTMTDAEFRAYNNLVGQGCLAFNERATLEQLVARVNGQEAPKESDFSKLVNRYGARI